MASRTDTLKVIRRPEEAQVFPRLYLVMNDSALSSQPSTLALLAHAVVSSND